MSEPNEENVEKPSHEPAEQPAQDKVDKLTSPDPPATRPKHPGRVEAGKRLAEWNRVNRAKKKATQEEAVIAKQTSPAADYSSGIDEHTPRREPGTWSATTIIGVAGLLISLIGLYRTRAAGVTQQQNIAQPSPPEPVREAVRQKSRLLAMD